MPPPTREDILIELDDPDQAKRVAAVPKVGALQPGAAVDVLAGVFAAEDDPLVRSRAVAALTRLDAPGRAVCCASGRSATTTPSCACRR